MVIKERKLFRQFLHESLNLPDTNLPVSSNSYQEIIRFDKKEGAKQTAQKPLLPVRQLFYSRAFYAHCNSHSSTDA